MQIRRGIKHSFQMLVDYKRLRVVQIRRGIKPKNDRSSYP